MKRPEDVERCRLRCAALHAGAVLLGASPATWAGTFGGEVGLEMEYLGESYFSELRLAAEDLDLPEGSPLIVADTTRFTDDSWLPGQRLELGFADTRGRIHLASRTAYNSERFLQDLSFRGDLPTGDGGRWRGRIEASYRDESRSLAGTGASGVLAEVVRDHPLGGATGNFRFSWERSRSLGDTTTYLLDFDVLRARASSQSSGSWLPPWEAYAEGSLKQVPGAEPGAYREVRTGGVWRPGGGSVHSLTLDLRARDYAIDGDVGRDSRSAELAWRGRLAGDPSASLDVEATGIATDYRGQDLLYFDSSDAMLYVSGRRETGPWTLAGGPAFRWFADLDGADGDFQELALRTSTGRLAGVGYAEISLEGGYRDYRSETPEVVDLSTLSTSFLRSDAWIVDLLVVGNVPVGLGLSLDLLASSSWEIHSGESERLQVTFVTLGVSRRF